MAKGQKRKAAPGDLATNRQASFRYNLVERFECGMVLVGTEVKSVRAGKATVKGIEDAIEDQVELYGGEVTERHERERRFILPLRRGVSTGGGVECTVAWAPADPDRAGRDLRAVDAWRRHARSCARARPVDRAGVRVPGDAAGARGSRLSGAAAVSRPGVRPRRGGCVVCARSVSSSSTGPRRC